VAPPPAPHGNVSLRAAGALIRIFSVPLAIVFTWLFNRTGGSLIPVLFLHSSRNTTSLFLSRNFIVSEMLFLVFAVVVVIKDKMWKRRINSDNLYAGTID
jgi:membrane protease YdiL (CAAX protease family)